jgi:uncharacterized membrane protein
MKQNTRTLKIALSGLVIAIYVVVMYFTQSFAFGQYQIRLATALYSMSYLYPFLVVPLALSNFLSNTIMGGLGIIDMIGGFLVGLLTAGSIYLIRKFNWSEWLVGLPILLFPGLIVPIWLSVLLHINYLVLMPSVLIGQIIPAILGILIVKYLKNVLPKVGSPIKK